MPYFSLIEAVRREVTASIKLILGLCQSRFAQELQVLQTLKQQISNSRVRHRKKLLIAMYASLTNLSKKAIGRGYTTKDQDPLHAPDAEHVYIRGDITNRSPCPGLNALANQGYLWVVILLCHCHD